MSVWDPFLIFQTFLSRLDFIPTFLGKIMVGQKIGYIRVSSVDQNTARQLDGIKLDKTIDTIRKK